MNSPLPGSDPPGPRGEVRARRFLTGERHGASREARACADPAGSPSRRQRAPAPSRSPFPGKSRTSSGRAERRDADAHAGRRPSLVRGGGGPAPARRRPGTRGFATPLADTRAPRVTEHAKQRAQRWPGGVTAASGALRVPFRACTHVLRRLTRSHTHCSRRARAEGRSERPGLAGWRAHAAPRAPPRLLEGCELPRREPSAACVMAARVPEHGQQTRCLPAGPPGPDAAASSSPRPRLPETW